MRVKILSSQYEGDVLSFECVELNAFFPVFHAILALDNGALVSENIQNLMVISHASKK
jgi:hypothetical protein